MQLENSATTRLGLPEMGVIDFARLRESNTSFETYLKRIARPLPFVKR